VREEEAKEWPSKKFPECLVLDDVVNGEYGFVELEECEEVSKTRMLCTAQCSEIRRILVIEAAQMRAEIQA
jgi:hypothetical protein